MKNPARVAEALGRIQQALREDDAPPNLSPEDLGVLVGVVVGQIGAQHERGESVALVPPEDLDIPTTSAMVTACAILDAYGVELFELGVFRTFSGV